MATVTAATQAPVSPATGPRTAITVAGLAAAVACAANIAGWFLLAVAFAWTARSSRPVED